MNSQFTKTVLIATLTGPIFGALGAIVSLLFLTQVIWIDDQEMANEMSRQLPQDIKSIITWAYPFFGVQSFANGLVFCFIGRHRSALPVWSILPVVLLVMALCVLLTVVMFMDPRGPVHGFSIPLVVGICLVHIFLGFGSWLLVRRFWNEESP